MADSGHPPAELHERLLICRTIKLNAGAHGGHRRCCHAQMQKNAQNKPQIARLILCVHTTLQVYCNLFLTFCPALLEALPARLIAESGMDAVSHCVEAAAAREASPVTDALAHSACRTLLRLLPRSFAGETAVRGDVHLAASMAALAFDNAGLGACHALAHALGGRFHVAHGRLCAMLLPHVIAHHAAADPHPYAALAAACGLPGVRGLTGAIVRLRARLGLPASLPEAGVPREAVLEAETDVLEAALADPCASQAPAPLTRDALQVLLRQVL